MDDCPEGHRCYDFGDFRLAGIAGIKVMAQTSSFALRGPHLDAREVGRRLDARYQVEGSLPLAGSRSAQFSTSVVEHDDVAPLRHQRAE